MRVGKTEKYICEKLKTQHLHFSLIDPDPNKTSIEKIAKTSAALEKSKTDAILVGGSTGIKNDVLDDAVRTIKKNCSVPVILFPGNAYSGLSKYADAILFMSMMNAKDALWITGMQAIGAPIVKEYEIEPIPMAYLVVEPGMTVGKKAELISRNEIEKAANYALAAQYLGMRFVYLEAGSGADRPVPKEMIRAVKEVIEIPLIVGGGIREVEQAKECIEAGADIIVTGTIIEKDIQKAYKIIEAVKSRKD